MKIDAKSKTVLVTGASAGIGDATVRAMLAKGMTVYAAARRVERMEPLAALGAHVLALDVTDEGSIAAAMQRIRDDGARLNVLVNNAGYGSYGALEDVPIDEARRQFEVNVFGAARLIQLALPMMREHKSGTIVNISSIGGKMYEPFGSWYHATKFALEGLSDCLRLELAPFGIDVVVIEPGAIKTEWTGIAMDSLLQRSGATAYAKAATAWAALMNGTGPRASEPSVIADTIVRAVLARHPKTRYAAGAFAGPILAAKWALPDRAFDALITAAARSAPRP